RAGAGRSSWSGDSPRRHGASQPSGASFIFLDAEALHPVAQLPESNAEQLGRRRTVEAGLAERLEDRLALYAVQVIGQRLGARRRSFRGGTGGGGRRGAAGPGPRAEFLPAGPGRRPPRDLPLPL